MTATTKIYELNGATPTATYTSAIYLQTRDSYAQDVNRDYPLKVTGSYAYSYWKHLKMEWTGSFTRVGNLGVYTSTGMWWRPDISVYCGRRDSGDNGCPDSDYEQATGTEGETGQGLLFHNYYGGQTPHYVDLTTFSEASPHLIDSTYYTSAGSRSKSVVLQVSISTDTPSGVRTGEILVFKWDEV